MALYVVGGILPTKAPQKRDVGWGGERSDPCLQASDGPVVS